MYTCPSQCPSMYTPSVYKEWPSSSYSVQGVSKLVHMLCTNWALAWAHTYISKQFPSLGTPTSTAELGSTRGIHDIIFSRFCMMFISHASCLFRSIFTVSAQSCNSNFIGYNFLYGHTHCKHYKHGYIVFSQLIREIRSDEIYILVSALMNLILLSPHLLQCNYGIIISVCSLHLCWCISN